MMLGLLLIAVLAAVGFSGLMVVLSQPLWVVILAYPIAGVSVLMSRLLVAALNATPRGSAPSTRHCPVPRITAPTVATSTLRSVANETSRSYAVSNSARWANVEALRSDTCQVPVIPGRNS